MWLSSAQVTPRFQLRPPTSWTPISGNWLLKLNAIHVDTVQPATSNNTCMREALWASSGELQLDPVFGTKTTFTQSVICSAILYLLQIPLYEHCMWISKLIECAFNFVVDGSAAYNDGSLTVFNSSSLGAQTTAVISLRKQFMMRGAWKYPHFYMSVSHHIVWSVLMKWTAFN